MLKISPEDILLLPQRTPQGLFWRVEFPGNSWKLELGIENFREIENLEDLGGLRGERKKKLILENGRYVSKNKKQVQQILWNSRSGVWIWIWQFRFPVYLFHFGNPSPGHALTHFLLPLLPLDPPRSFSRREFSRKFRMCFVFCFQFSISQFPIFSFCFSTPRNQEDLGGSGWAEVLGKVWIRREGKYNLTINVWFGFTCNISCNQKWHQ